MANVSTLLLQITTILSTPLGPLSLKLRVVMWKSSDCLCPLNLVIFPGDQLKFNGTSEEVSYTDCIEWGASANDLASALNDLSSVKEVDVNLTVNTTGLDVFGSSTLALDDDLYADGLLEVGDVITISDSEEEGMEYTIQSISQSGRLLTFTEVFYASSGMAGEGKAVTKILQDPILVQREGHGESVPECRP